jgi:hypothetical protein
VAGAAGVTNAGTSANWCALTPDRIRQKPLESLMQTCALGQKISNARSRGEPAHVSNAQRSAMGSMASLRRRQTQSITSAFRFAIASMK